MVLSKMHFIEDLASRATGISSKIFSKPTHYDSADHEGFRRSQRLAYQCALEIRKELKLGWTEKRVAQMMDEYLHDHGVKTFFHKSFAWYGERTRFDGMKKYWDFMPSSKRTLQEDDVIILDTAPILDGYTADIGYTFSLKPHQRLAQAKNKLIDFRNKLPRLFNSELSTSHIWRQVDSELIEAGYDNAHKKYPFGVLGHRVHRIGFSNLPGVTIPFSLHSYGSFLSRGLLPELLGPRHRGKKTGLWAIEPHLGGQGFGAKFEEILVVEPSGKAYWLDDQVPHVLEANLGEKNV